MNINTKAKFCALVTISSIIAQVEGAEPSSENPPHQTRTGVLPRMEQTAYRLREDARVTSENRRAWEHAISTQIQQGEADDVSVDINLGEKKFFGLSNLHLSIQNKLTISVASDIMSHFRSQENYQLFETNIKRLFDFLSIFNELLSRGPIREYDNLIDNANRRLRINLSGVFNDLRSALANVPELEERRYNGIIDGEKIEEVGRSWTGLSIVKNKTATVGRFILLTKKQTMSLYLSALKYLVSGFNEIKGSKNEQAKDYIKLVVASCRLIEDMILFKVRKIFNQ